MNKNRQHALPWEQSEWILRRVVNVLFAVILVIGLCPTLQISALTASQVTPGDSQSQQQTQDQAQGQTQDQTQDQLQQQAQQQEQSSIDYKNDLAQAKTAYEDALKTLTSAQESLQALQQASSTDDDALSQAKQAVTDAQTASDAAQSTYKTLLARQDGSLVSVGDAVSYSFDWKNKTSDSTPVTITAQLPQGVDYLSSSSGVYDAQSRMVTWTVQASGGDSGTVTLNTIISDQATGLLSVVAHVSINGTEDTSQAQTLIHPVASLTYTDVGDNPHPALGSSMNYRIDYGNGTDAAADVGITVSIPEGVDYVTGSSSGIFDKQARTLTFQKSDVPSKEVTSYTFVVVPTKDFTDTSLNLQATLNVGTQLPTTVRSETVLAQTTSTTTESVQTDTQDTSQVHQPTTTLSTESSAEPEEPQSAVITQTQTATAIGTNPDTATAKAHLSQFKMLGMIDGAGSFDATAGDGNDVNNSNNIVRTYDQVVYKTGYSIDLANNNDQDKIVSGTMHFEMTLPVGSSVASWDTKTMAWLQNAKVTDTGSSQTLTGDVTISSDTGSTFAPRSGTINWVIAVGSAANKTIIGAPTCKMWIDDATDNTLSISGNTDTYKVTVSAAPNYNMAISAEAGGSYSGKNRQSYGLVFQLKNKALADGSLKGILGLEKVDGRKSVSFHVVFKSTIAAVNSGISVIDYKQNNASAAGSQGILTASEIASGVPLDNDGTSRETLDNQVYDGGQWAMSATGQDASFVVTGVEVDPEVASGVRVKHTASHSSSLTPDYDESTLCLSSGMVTISYPTVANSSGSLTATVGTFSAESISGVQSTTETTTADNVTTFPLSWSNSTSSGSSNGIEVDQGIVVLKDGSPVRQINRDITGTNDGATAVSTGSYPVDGAGSQTLIYKVPYATDSVTALTPGDTLRYGVDVERLQNYMPGSSFNGQNSSGWSNRVADYEPFSFGGGNVEVFQKIDGNAVEPVENSTLWSINDLDFSDSLRDTVFGTSWENTNASLNRYKAEGRLSTEVSIKYVAKKDGANWTSDTEMENSRLLNDNGGIKTTSNFEVYDSYTALKAAGKICVGFYYNATMPDMSASLMNVRLSREQQWALMYSPELRVKSTAAVKNNTLTGDSDAYRLKMSTTDVVSTTTAAANQTNGVNGATRTINQPNGVSTGAALANQWYSTSGTGTQSTGTGKNLWWYENSSSPEQTSFPYGYVDRSFNDGAYYVHYNKAASTTSDHSSDAYAQSSIPYRHNYAMLGGTGLYIAGYGTSIEKNVMQTVSVDSQSQQRTVFNLDQQQNRVDYEVKAGLTVPASATGYTAQDIITVTDTFKSDSLKAYDSSVTGTTTADIEKKYHIAYGGTYTQDATTNGGAGGSWSNETDMSSYPYTVSEKVAADGTVTLTWVFTGWNVGTPLPTIHYSLSMDTTSQAGTNVSNTATIHAAALTAAADKAATVGITPVRTDGVILLKSCENEIRGSNEDARFSWSFTNSVLNEISGITESHTIAKANVIDILPFEGDWRGSTAPGDYTFSDVTFSGNALGSSTGMTLYYTTTDAKTLFEDSGCYTYTKAADGSYSNVHVDNDKLSAYAFPSWDSVKITVDSSGKITNGDDVSKALSGKKITAVGVTATNIEDNGTFSLNYHHHWDTDLTHAASAQLFNSVSYATSDGLSATSADYSVPAANEAGVIKGSDVNDQTAVTSDQTIDYYLAVYNKDLDSPSYTKNGQSMIYDTAGYQAYNVSVQDEIPEGTTYVDGSAEVLPGSTGASVAQWMKSAQTTQGGSATTLTVQDEYTGFDLNTFDGTVTTDHDVSGGKGYTQSADTSVNTVGTIAANIARDGIYGSSDYVTAANATGSDKAIVSSSTTSAGRTQLQWYIPSLKGTGTSNIGYTQVGTGSDTTYNSDLSYYVLEGSNYLQTTMTQTKFDNYKASLAADPTNTEKYYKRSSAVSSGEYVVLHYKVKVGENSVTEKIRNNANYQSNYSIGSVTQPNALNTTYARSTDQVVHPLSAIPQIKVSKNAQERMVKQGNDGVFTIVVENLGSDDLQNVTLDDPYAVDSSGKQIVGSFDATYDATQAPSATTITVNGTHIDINSLKIGESITFTYRVPVPSDAAAGERYDNTVTTSGVGVKSKKTVTDEDIDYVKTPNDIHPSIKVEKTIAQHLYNPGETATFDIKVTNTSSEALEQVTLDDTMIYGSTKGAFKQGSCSVAATIEDTKVVLTDNLEPGASATVQYTYTVATNAADDSRYENLVTATGIGVTSHETVNDADTEWINTPHDETTIAPQIDVKKTVDAHDKNPGDKATFTITVTNNGVEALKDVVLDDVMTFEGSNGWFDRTTWTVSDPEHTTSVVPGATHVDINYLAVGESVTIAYYFNVPIATDTTSYTSKTYDNKVSTAGTGVTSGKLVTDDDMDWVRTPSVQPEGPEIKVSKVASERLVKQGENATFTIVVENLGREHLKDVTLDDPYMVDKSGNKVAGAFSATYDASQAPSATTISVNGTHIDINSLKVGEYITFTYTAQVPSTAEAGTTFDNTVTTTGVGINSGTKVTDDDIDYVNTPDDIHPSISVNKTIKQHTWQPGETATFTIEVTNNGVETLKNVTLNDTMVYGDASGRFKPGSCSVDATINDTQVVLTDQLAPGASATVEYEYTVSKDAAGDSLYDNLVTATGVGITSNERVNDSSQDYINTPATVTSPVPKIKVTKTVDAHDKNPGEVATFTIKVTNVGDEDLKNVTLPDTMVYGDATGAYKQGSCSVAATIEDTKVTLTDTLAVGASATMEYVFTVPGSTTDASYKANVYDNQVTATGIGVTSNKQVSDSDKDWVRTPEKREVVPQINITKSADASLVQQGAKGTFTIVVSNAGTEDLKDVTLDDPKVTSSAGDEIVGAFSSTYDASKAPSATTITVNGTTVTINSLKVGEAITFSYSFDVPAAAADATTYDNTVTTQGTGVTSNKIVDDSDADSVYVSTGTETPHIKLTKNANEGVVDAGSAASFTVVVKNNGSEDLKDVVVSDPVVKGSDGTEIKTGSFSADYENHAHAPISVTMSDSNQTITIDSLKIGEWLTFTYHFTVPTDAASGTNYDNTASVVGVGVTSNTQVTDEDDDDVTTPGTDPSPQITIEKTITQHEWKPGETAVFSIKVTNSGKETLKDVTLNDSMVYGSSSGRFVDGSCSVPATIEATKVTLTGQLAPGASATVSYSYQVPDDAATGSTYDNLVSTVGTGVTSGKKVTSSDDEDIYTPGSPAVNPQITVKKRADTRDKLPGQLATFTITVTNEGIEDLKDLHLDDSMVYGDAVGYYLEDTDHPWKASDPTHTTSVAKDASNASRVNIDYLAVSQSVTLYYRFSVPTIAAGAPVQVAGQSDEEFTNAFNTWMNEYAGSTSYKGSSFDNKVSVEGTGVTTGKKVTDDDHDWVRTPTWDYTAGDVIKGSDPADQTTVSPGQEITYYLIAYNRDLDTSYGTVTGDPTDKMGVTDTVPEGTHIESAGVLNSTTTDELKAWTQSVTDAAGSKVEDEYTGLATTTFNDSMDHDDTTAGNVAPTTPSNAQKVSGLTNSLITNGTYATNASSTKSMVSSDSKSVTWFLNSMAGSTTKTTGGEYQVLYMKVKVDEVPVSVAKIKDNALYKNKYKAVLDANGNAQSYPAVVASDTDALSSDQVVHQLPTNPVKGEIVNGKQYDPTNDGVAENSAAAIDYSKSTKDTQVSGPSLEVGQTFSYFIEQRMPELIGKDVDDMTATFDDPLPEEVDYAGDATLKVTVNGTVVPTSSYTVMHTSSPEDLKVKVTGLNPADVVRVTFDVTVVKLPEKNLIKNQATTIVNRGSATNDYTTNEIYNPTPHKDVYAPAEGTKAGEYTTSIDGKDVNAGDELYYEVTYANAQAEASDVSVTDTIPTYTTYKAGSIGYRVVDAAGNDITGSVTCAMDEGSGSNLSWTFKAVPSHARIVAFFSVIADALDISDYPEGAYVDNVATVNGESTNKVRNHLNPAPDVPANPDEPSAFTPSTYVPNVLTGDALSTRLLFMICMLTLGSIAILFNLSFRRKAME
ncbi:MAG: hypothetical protein LKF61_04510 [Eggerthellaceae bacterium]|jgi:uncharacterized repeat protein (TIGR01451 family)|nr:hypothetical protein [Eggerthellaceae bacterium]